MHCAAAAIDPVVQEVQLADAAPRLLTVQANLDGGFRPCARRTSISDIVCLAHIEVEIEGIERDDGRESCRAGRAHHQAADGNTAHAQAATERCHDPGKLQTELRPVAPSLARLSL